MKDHTTHIACKPEHAFDLDTGAVVAVEIHPADEGESTTLKRMLQVAESNTWVSSAWQPSAPPTPTVVVTVLTLVRFCTTPPAAPASEVIAITAAG